MFPGKIFLDVSDIAKILNVSKWHIYRLSSTKKLPFILDDHTDKVQVSIVAMAKYLDKKINEVVSEELEQEPKVEAPSVPDLIKKPKRGRPRNSSKSQLAFQSSLQLAIMQEEIFNVFQDIQEKIKGMEYPTSEEVACSTKFNEAKNDFSQFASYGEKYLNHAFFELRFGISPKQKRKKEF